MVNILLERYIIDGRWLFDDLKNYIKPYHRVLVVAFSFRDNRVQGLLDWENLYGKESGKFYGGITNSLSSYGVKEENIVFLNYFSDTKATAIEKVQSADILYFLGGLPDRMYDRLKEFDLIETMSKHKGVVMGYSAGAVVQLSEYHLSPDKDYPEFNYYKGLPYLNKFYIEVHFENTEVQITSIRKVLSEKQKTVYAMHETGAIIVDNGVVKLLGDVEVFNPTL